MMIENEDGTFAAGPLDVLLILHDVNMDTYHPAFLEEAPPPGSVAEHGELHTVRLKSKMHHTMGTANLASAKVHLDDLAKKILVVDQNICRRAVPWDGRIGFVWIVENWRGSGNEKNVSDVLPGK